MKDTIKQLIENMVEKQLKEGYYTIDAINPPSIEEVIEKWVSGQKAYDDRPHAWYPVSALRPYKEYEWTREKARRSPEEWDELKASIEENGFSAENPIIVLVGKNGKAKIGEGNHRLAVAEELNLSRVPVMFMFYQNVE